MNSKQIKVSCIFLTLISLQSCCTFNDGNVIDSILLSEEDKAMIPYQNEEIIAFQHSEGYVFDVVVSTTSRFVGEQEHCEDYYIYETFEANFNSSLPRINFNIKLNKWNPEAEAFFGITTNDFVFFIEDTTTPPQDLNINGVVYSDLKSYKSSDDIYYINEILYNTSVGIVQINYKDQTYVQIIP